jgi:glycosyltransferase involved in cell wall biosynthesis
MSRHAPKISVCVPAYNAAAYLPAAIDSVLSQEFSDFELVVSDDCSSDDTPRICAGYSDPRFRAVRSEERLRQSGNWNRCLELARGEYVILLHADDELLPGYLERAAAALGANQDAALVSCSVRHIDEDGSPLELQRLFDEDTIDREEVVLRRLLLDGCVINPAGVTVRRAVYDRVGPFTDKIVWGVDWHMWIRIALGSPIAYIAAPLARYREHGHSGTTAVMASGRNARDESWLMDDVFGLIERTRPELAGLRKQARHGVAHRTWCFAESSCEAGEMDAARVGLRNAIRIWPAMALQPKVWGLLAATYTGYRWFARTHALTQAARRVLGLRASATD